MGYNLLNVTFNQILCILTVTFNEMETRYGIVQFLKLKENTAPLPEYVCEYQFNGRSNIKLFSPPHLISCDSFAKISYIIPCKFESVTNSVPRHTDIGCLAINRDGRT